MSPTTWHTIPLGVRVAYVGNGQDIGRGILARRDSSRAVIDTVIDARRGVARRVRVHARFVYRDYL